MMNQCCERMQSFLDEGKLQISYISRFREYGIKTSSGGIQTMDFCPWCGATLPVSLRDEWFEELEKIGIEADLFPKKGEVPVEFLTEAWWLKLET